MPKPSVSTFTNTDPAVDASTVDRPLQSYSHVSAEDQSDEETNHDLDLVKPPESLSHFSYEVVDALYDLLTSADGVSFEERRLRSYFERHWTETYKHSHSLTTLRHQEVQSYFEQSIYYILSNPDTLLKSFKDGPTGRRRQKAPCSKLLLFPCLADQAFRLLLEDRSALVFQSLWQAVEVLFTPPPGLVPRRSSRSKASVTSSTPRGSQSYKGKVLDPGANQPRYLTDAEACHIVMLGFHALVAAVPRTVNIIGNGLHKLRGLGKVGPDHPNFDPALRRPFGDFMRCVEVFEDEMGLRLACRLIRGLAARLYFVALLKDKVIKGGITPVDEDQRDLTEVICTYLRVSRSRGFSTQWEQLERGPDDRGGAPEAERQFSPWPMPAVIVEWIRTVIMKTWDGKETVSRFGVVGSAITILKMFCQCAILSIRGGVLLIDLKMKGENGWDSPRSPSTCLTWLIGLIPLT